MLTLVKFRLTIWNYYRSNKREMPWRRTHDPYRILISEIMLQQTQVGRVEGFYKNFLKQFPDFRALAQAKTPDVLRAWQGLGYNRRALALQKLAKEVIAPRFKGKLPRDLESLISLPGIGPYTAGAIRAFAFNEPEIFIETNIRRVFIQFFFPRRKQVTDAELRRYIERTIDSKNPREWYYALMDYGAMLGEVARHTKNAKKETNPNRRSAHYVRQSAFAGSDREVRGYVLRELLKRKKVAIREITEHFDRSAEKISGIISGLAKEGFIIKKGNFIELTH